MGEVVFSRRAACVVEGESFGKRRLARPAVEGEKYVGECVSAPTDLDSLAIVGKRKRHLSLRAGLIASITCGVIEQITWHLARAGKGLI